MNIGELREEIIRATEIGYGADGSMRLHESKDVVVKVADTGETRWLELDAVGIAFVNGRFVLQLTAWKRDGEPGVHR